MAIKVTDSNGNTVKIAGRGLPGVSGQNGRDGQDGKSAYDYAVAGGYTGTEAEFQALMGTGPWIPQVWKGAANGVASLEFGKVPASQLPMLTKSVTYYVSNAGNDLKGDGTQGNPFSTIQNAINRIPKNLNGLAAYIKVEKGIYNENLIIFGFYGGGDPSYGIYIESVDRSSPATINSVNMHNNSACVTLSSFAVSASGKSIPILLRNNFSVDLSRISCEKADINGTGVHCYNGILSVNGCTLSNWNTALHVTKATVYINGGIFNGNETAVKSGSSASGAGAIVLAYRPSIQGGTPYVSERGGLIFVNGALQSLDARVGSLEAETTAISAAIERGLSL